MSASNYNYMQSRMRHQAEQYADDPRYDRMVGRSLKNELRAWWDYVKKYPKDELPKHTEKLPPGVNKEMMFSVAQMFGLSRTLRFLFSKYSIGIVLMALVYVTKSYLRARKALGKVPLSVEREIPEEDSPTLVEPPLQKKVRKETPARSSPSRSQKESPSRSKKESPTRSQKESPSRSKKESPTRSQKESPSRSKKESPSRSRKKESPSRSRKKETVE